MIVEFLLGLVSWILQALLLPLSVENLPVQFAEVWGTIISYLVTGCAYVSAYIDVPYILALLAFVVSFSAVITTYRIVLWIVKKIPFLNIK